MVPVNCIIPLLLSLAVLAIPQVPGYNGSAQRDVGVVEEQAYLTTNRTEASDETTCTARCTLYYPEISAISWVPKEQIVYTTEITVGVISTLVFLHNRSTVAVKTQTEYDWAAAPENRFPPQLATDLATTAVAIVALTYSDSTTVLQMQYPSIYIDYGTEYSWEGTVRFYGESNGYGTSICASATAGPSTVSISKHTKIQYGQYGQYDAPTEAAMTNGTLHSPSLQPLWVPLDVEEDIVKVIDYGITGYDFANCERPTRTSSTGSTYSTAKFLFQHVTAIIPVDKATIIRPSTQTWQNATNAVPHYTNDTQRKAAEFETPRPRWFENDCMPTLGSGSSRYHDASGSTSTGDRTGYYQRKTTGWEEITMLPFISHPAYSPASPTAVSSSSLLKSRSTPGAQETYDMELKITRLFGFQQTVEGFGGRTQTQQPHQASATEYVNELPVGRLSKEFSPKHTEQSEGAGTGQGRIDTGVIAKYFKEYPEVPPRIDDAEDLHIALTAGPMNAYSSVDAQALQTAPANMPDSSVTKARSLIYTDIATTVGDAATKIPGYIVLESSIVAVSEEVTINGSPTTLSIPDLLPTYVSTTMDGIPVSTLAYIVSGQSTASIGQTVTLDGKPTVLSLPSAVFAHIITTVGGSSTATPVFIIGGSSTASIGQEIILNGTLTKLAVPDFMPTLMTVSMDGITGPEYAFIVGSSSVATIGQTVTFDGETTVLSAPTGPLMMKDGAAESWAMSWNVACVVVGAIFLALL